MLVSYEYYRDTYGGRAVKEQEFTLLSRQAEDLVAYYSFNRIYRDMSALVSTKVKDTICQLIDNQVNLKSKENIKSSSIDGVSVSYETAVDINKSNLDIIKIKLMSTNLLNRGF